MPESAGMGTLLALVILIAASVWLGTLAHRVVQRSQFVRGYFLGNRALGSWALALTATVQSGGTFMGFPSYVYSHGWIVALWIASYMVVPITGFGVLGKRLAQLSRRTGAITVPDLMRERFGSPAVGLMASLFILVTLTIMMIAQFKFGAIIMKVCWPGSGALALTEELTQEPDRYYYLGLVIFSLTVVGYTLIGGFLAAVWTDLFQSVIMIVGVLILLPLTLSAAGGLENASRTLQSATVAPPGTLLTGPGPDGWFPIGLGVSFFFVWVFGGMASTASQVRIMASKSTETIRRSIYLLATYNFFIYVPLIVICICGRSLLPDLSAKHSDEIIPRLAILTTGDLPGGALVAGLILAAPFGAIMATVSCYLVVIASGLVRDIYQRFINPHASDITIKRLSYASMLAVGAVAVLANLYPPDFMQAMVVLSTTCGASIFLAPTVMALYWRRATAAGVMSAMVAGFLTTATLYGTNWLQGVFRPYLPFGLDPIIWGLLISFAAGIIVSLRTLTPDARRVSLCFDPMPAQAAPAKPAPS